MKFWDHNYSVIREKMQRPFKELVEEYPGLLRLDFCFVYLSAVKHEYNLLCKNTSMHLKWERTRKDLY